MNTKLPDFRTYSFLVVGDLMLDRYLWGDVERISPEAPVPVVKINHETARAGGAGNVAANLAGLGAQVDMAGYLGSDAQAATLISLLEDAGIGVSGVLRLTNRITTTKTRVMGGHQQMLRLDREIASIYSKEEQNALIELLSERFMTNPPDVLLLSDYAKGSLSTDICQQLIRTAKLQGVPIYVDPKGNCYEKYRGATCVTPNKREAAEVCGVPERDMEKLIVELENVRRRFEFERILLTRGEEGISTLSKGGVRHFPATAKQVFDVSGAGDTVMATFAAAMVAGVDQARACELANVAAGIVVGKVGTVPIDINELQSEIERQIDVTQAEKICEVGYAKEIISSWKAKGECVVFTNGCFDLLHVGHVTYLEKARKIGDRLVVGLNTDRSVRALKGQARPVIGEIDRARVLAALESVDAVVFFDQDTPLELIMSLKPDVLVKGSDYSEDEVIGATEIRSWGGRVELIPVVPGRSTSGILQAMNRQNDA